jgi:hypothetical protein
MTPTGLNVALPLHMSHTHLRFFIQQSFKSTIEFVGPNVGSINQMVDLKMRCV